MPGYRPFAAIAAGYDYTLALDINGRVWAWGLNYFNQLGIDDLNNRSLPTLIDYDLNWEAFESITAIQAGGDDTGSGIAGHSFRPQN